MLDAGLGTRLRRGAASCAAELRRAADPALLVHVAKRLRAEVYGHVEPRRRMTAGPDLHMSPTVSLRNGERIVLGRGVHVGERSSLWAGDSSGRIVLGDHVVLAPGVFVTASDYGTAAGTHIKDQPRIERDVRIGDGAWLGAGVVVVAGVSIGAGAVVGAGSVVTRDLPADCIAVGAPAKVVGRRAGPAVEVLRA